MHGRPTHQWARTRRRRLAVDSPCAQLPGLTTCKLRARGTTCGQREMPINAGCRARWPAGGASSSAGRRAHAAAEMPRGCPWGMGPLSPFLRRRPIHPTPPPSNLMQTLRRCAGVARRLRAAAAPACTDGVAARSQARARTASASRGRICAATTARAQRPPCLASALLCRSRRAECRRVAPRARLWRRHAALQRRAGTHVCRGARRGARGQRRPAPRGDEGREHERQASIPRHAGARHCALPPPHVATAYSPCMQGVPLMPATRARAAAPLASDRRRRRSTRACWTRCCPFSWSNLATHTAARTCMAGRVRKQWRLHASAWRTSSALTPRRSYSRLCVARARRLRRGQWRRG
jgi:hypothetical protein